MLSHNNISMIGMGILCDMACVYHLGQDVKRPMQPTYTICGLFFIGRILSFTGLSRTER